MSSICDFISKNDSGYPLDDTGYKKLQVTPHKSNHELTGGWNTPSPKQQESFSI
jgi:hypothetical protein